MSRSASSLVAPLAACLALLAAPGCGEGAGQAFDDSWEEDVNGLYNGTAVSTNPNGVIALYMRIADTPTSPWFDNPCSGVVLNPSATNNYFVLTARHCVTVDGTGTDGPVMHAYAFKVSAAVNPGKQPPANAADACDVMAPPYPNNGYLGLDMTLDLALVRVCQAIPSLSATATPLYAATSGSLMGEDGIHMYGYGFTGTDPASYGILRRSSGHVIDDAHHGGATGYDYNTIHLTHGDNDSYTVGGDSGGPTYWLGNGNGALKTQIGVHSALANDETAISRVTQQWIAGRLGRFYIRPQDAMNRALSRSSDQVGATVNAAATSGINPSDLPSRQWFVYDFPTRHITTALAYFPTCLRRNSDSTLTMVACNATADSQKWWFTPEHTLSDSTETSCLKRSGTSGAVVAQCSSSDTSQKWYLDGDSHVAGVF